VAKKGRNQKNWIVKCDAKMCNKFVRSRTGGWQIWMVHEALAGSLSTLYRVYFTQEVGKKVVPKQLTLNRLMGLTEMKPAICREKQSLDAGALV
jgi:hypothetical protein